MKLEDNRRPVMMIVIGFVLVTLGMVLPFLMVMQLIKSTFFLNFFSFGATVAGLFLGLLGGALYVKITQAKKKNNQ
jgi:hypothetical protein